eukprot:6920481-Lingulodinium_polyedra.AAC.1
MASQWPVNGQSIAVQRPVNGQSSTVRWPCNGLLNRQPMAIAWPDIGQSMAIRLSQRPTNGHAASMT